MKKEYIQPIIIEVLVELSCMMAGTTEKYETDGEGAGAGEGGPPSGLGGPSAKGNGSLWDEAPFSNDVISDEEE